MQKIFYQFVRICCAARMDKVLALFVDCGIQLVQQGSPTLKCPRNLCPLEFERTKEETPFPALALQWRLTHGVSSTWWFSNRHDDKRRAWTPRTFGHRPLSRSFSPLWVHGITVRSGWLGSPSYTSLHRALICLWNPFTMVVPLSFDSLSMKTELWMIFPPRPHSRSSSWDVDCSELKSIFRCSVTTTAPSCRSSRSGMIILSIWADIVTSLPWSLCPGRRLCWKV